MIKHKKDNEGMYIFDIAELMDMDLFLVKLTNNELSRTLNGLKRLLNTKAAIDSMADKDEFLQSMLATLIAGGLNIDSVHAEVILSNQIRDDEDILRLPQWEYENTKYKMITLNTALTDHPSVTVSLEYQKLAKSLYYPLTYKKTAPHPIDLLFMVNPQRFMIDELVDGEEVESDIEKPENISPIKYY